MRSQGPDCPPSSTSGHGPHGPLAESIVRAGLARGALATSHGSMRTAAGQDPCLTVCSKGSLCSISGLATKLGTVHWEACFSIPNYSTPRTTPSTPVCTSMFQSGKVKGRDHASPHISYPNPSAMDNRFSIGWDPTLSFFSTSSGPLEHRLKYRLGNSHSYPPDLRRMIPKGSRASHQHSGFRAVRYSFYAKTYGVASCSCT